MTNRREFLQIGIAAASAWPLASHAASPERSAARLPLYKVVYDTRFPQSAAFARRIAQLGVAAQAIDGDMTRFWYDDLYHRWRQGPIAIAGLTAHGPLFCFEQLALDQRMRVVFRVEHRPGVGCVQHELSGPAGMLGGVRGAISDGDWPERMAEAVSRCPSGRSEIGTAAGSTTATGALPLGESLYSWVIAPATRV